MGKGLPIDISPTRDADKLSSLHRMMIDAAWVHRYVGVAIKEHFAYMGIDIGEQGDICGPRWRGGGGDEGADGGDAASGEDAVREGGRREILAGKQPWTGVLTER